MPGQERLELATEEEVDPRQQDRRHARRVTRFRARIRAVTGDADFLRGLELMRRGDFFEAHEELELAWRAAPAGERDFLQGLVHVTVAWYQAGRGRPVACASQLGKARRRLASYAPRHRGVDIEDVLDQVEAARQLVETGSLALAPLRV
jgi:predicted metal-dependent hydrolase